MGARGKLGLCALALVMALLFAPRADAQLNSAGVGVNLNAVQNPFIAVAASPAAVNFNGASGAVVNGDSAVTISTSWSLPFGFSGFIANVSLWAYFTPPNPALTDGAGSNIPAARVSGSVNGGAFAPFTTAGPFSTSSRQIFSVNTLALGNLTRTTRTDTLALRIDTSGLGLPAGVYTGVLRIQARAI